MNALQGVQVCGDKAPNHERDLVIALHDNVVQTPNQRRRVHLARLPAGRQDGQASCVRGRIVGYALSRRCLCVSGLFLHVFDVFLSMSSDTNLRRSDSDRSQKLISRRRALLSTTLLDGLTFRLLTRPPVMVVGKAYTIPEAKNVGGAVQHGGPAFS